MKATVNESISVAGISFSERATITADFALGAEISVPAAKASTLTTRTDNTTGTITGPVSHGITTSQVVDLYWLNGVRRSVVVGTVAGQSIPLTNSGNGDNLPVQGTAINVAPRITINAVATGDKVQGIFVATPTSGRGTFSLNHGGGAAVIKTLDASKVWHWESGNGDTNPAAGVTTTTFILSQEGASAATMKATLLANN